MFPNLLGQKAARHLTDEDMAAIIGISRTAYQAKKKSGRFTAEECHKFCTYFGKSFEYLFAKDVIAIEGMLSGVITPSLCLR